MRKTFKYNYTAFGSVLSDSGTFDNNYRYTSQAIDENDLYYLHARYYDKSLGRWITPDPASGIYSIPRTEDHAFRYMLLEMQRNMRKEETLK